MYASRNEDFQEIVRCRSVPQSSGAGDCLVQYIPVSLSLMLVVIVETWSLTTVIRSPHANASEQSSTMQSAGVSETCNEDKRLFKMVQKRGPKMRHNTTCAMMALGRADWWINWGSCCFYSKQGELTIAMSVCAEEVLGEKLNDDADRNAFEKETKEVT